MIPSGPFLDRTLELQELNARWRRGRPELFVLYGKRRVGKTELVRQFLRGKPSLYFFAERTNDEQQRRRFASLLAARYGDPLLAGGTAPDWSALLAYPARRRERLVLALDEFPYLVEANPALPSILQRAWDESLSHSRIFLILLGSSVGLMETEVLSARAPLFGRRTGQWRLQPLPFYAARRFRPRAGFDDALHFYAVAGGMPAYWKQFDPRLDFWRNLETHALRRGAFLYEEVEFLLREELREPRHYFALLAAIAQGKRKLSEIVNATGLPQATANKYLSVLGDLGFVRREVPITEKVPLKSKKGLYRLEDPFTRFWFRLVHPVRDWLELDDTARAVRRIRSRMPALLAEAYEDLAPELLRQKAGTPGGPPPLERVGRWWDRHAEVDVVGVNGPENLFLAGEVKWSRRPVGVNVYQDLRAKAAHIEWGRPGRKEVYALFSRSGFTPDLRRLARTYPLYLFHGDRLLT